MKAVGFRQSLPASDENALDDIILEMPTPGPRDLLVRVKAVSVNPVDVKVRALMPPETGHKVLGYDAAGTVVAVESDVSLFKPGDDVFYSGDITRPGTNAVHHLVDERIVGRKPSSLTFADAAAIPLTAITAWEMVFDCFDLEEGGGSGDALLIIGGAGGVGSILIQIAKKLTNLTVIATASRPETSDWCKAMGADHIINHRNPLDEEIKALGITPRYVAALTGSNGHFDAIIELIKPRGEIGLIDDPGPIDISKIKPKALSFHWEFMFTRSMFETDDMITQHKLLNRIADLVDQGTIVTTAQRNLGELSAKTLLEAHKLQESGRAIGKTILEGYSD
ncbi:MAG: zinc-binding alcohol dehydrogenase family protein [Pseudomonadota bacterium]